MQRFSLALACVAALCVAATAADSTVKFTIEAGKHDRASVPVQVHVPIPKDLADFHVADRPVGPALRTSCDANVGGSPIAAARFTAARIPSLRTPFRFTVNQERADGTRVLTPVSGSSRNMLVHGRWDFGTDGPLSWLQGRKPVGSFRLDDFRVTFGG